MAQPSHLVHIGQNIKMIREQRGLTQEALAEAAGIARTHLIDMEAGKNNFTINTLVRIASALNVYLDISFTPIQ